MLSSDLLGEVNKSHGLRHDRADAGSGGTVWGWGSVHARTEPVTSQGSRGCRGGQSSPGGRREGTDKHDAHGRRRRA